IFAFDHPDFLGMPAYEFLTWGFYTLHTIRFLNGAPPQGRWITVLISTGAFAVPFGAIADPNVLFFASASLLLVFFAMYHEPMDLAYAGYLAVVGQLVEHVGEATRQWHYPGQSWGGVPLWLLTLWAGFGLFTRRLVLPLLPQPSGRGPSSSFCITGSVFQPFAQFRPPPPFPRSLHGDRQRLPLSDQHHQPLAARHPRVNQIPLQHRVVLGAEWDDDRGVFRPLTLVDCRRIR